jgi:hypothetical protein
MPAFFVNNERVFAHALISIRGTIPKIYLMDAAAEANCGRFVVVAVGVRRMPQIGIHTHDFMWPSIAEFTN